MGKDIDITAQRRGKTDQRRRPLCIMAKKVLRSWGSNVKCPVFYQVKWKQELPNSQEGAEEKWLNFQRLKYFLDMVERYEIANYDGPAQIKHELNTRPIDDYIEPEMISCNTAGLEVPKKKIQEPLRVQESFIHQPNQNQNIQNSMVTTINVQLKSRYRQKHVQKNILQGSYQNNDRAEFVLNYIKIPQINKYSFLVTWKTRQDGSKPNPSWVEEDQIKTIQPQLMKQIIKDKKLNIEFKE